MEKITVSVQVIKTYVMEIEAKDEETALEIAQTLQTTEIEKIGSLVCVESEYFEASN